MYSPAEGVVRIKNGLSGTAPVETVAFGGSGQRVVAADWAGDGAAGLGSFRPADLGIRLDDPAVSSPGTIAPAEAESDWLPVAGTFGFDR